MQLADKMNKGRWRAKAPLASIFIETDFQVTRPSSSNSSSLLFPILQQQLSASKAAKVKIRIKRNNSKSMNDLQNSSSKDCGFFAHCKLCKDGCHSISLKRSLSANRIKILLFLGVQGSFRQKRVFLLLPTPRYPQALLLQLPLLLRLIKFPQFRRWFIIALFIATSDYPPTTFLFGFLQLLSQTCSVSFWKDGKRPGRTKMIKNAKCFETVLTGLSWKLELSKLLLS